VKRFIDAALIGSKRTATLQYQDDLARQLGFLGVPGAPRDVIHGHDQFPSIGHFVFRFVGVLP
jgi:hypothetical protein